MPDILDEIVSRRKADLSRLGPEFGSSVPAHRLRAVVPFLDVPGAILEVKRASPSKGDIAPGLDPVTVVGQYAAAGARNVSVLTERNYFKGSLDDLVAVSSRYPAVSFLRKDFVTGEDEIEVSYRAGADAVLLIARILDARTLLRLAASCRSFGMTAFVEVRDRDDLDKLDRAFAAGPVLAGVNSRDLATFRIDPLVPATLRSRLPCRTVFESGTSTPGAARFARRLGFDGILIGEAAARDPESAGALVSSFLGSRPDWVGQFWREIARRAAARRESGGNANVSGGHARASGAFRPLVKVCGITNADDALMAASLGADLLGFVFAESPRETDAATVRSIASALDALPSRPLLVGVIVDASGERAKTAYALALDGVLDAVQYHGENALADFARIDEAGGQYGIGRYAVVRLGSEDDLAKIDELAANGEPRVLVDARVAGIAGGTGSTIPKSLVRRLSERGVLWIAGGINPANVRGYIDEFAPELLDASSGLESVPGKKDHVALKAFFREIDR